MQADREKDKQVCDAQSILKWFGMFMAGCLEVSTRQNELFDLRFAVSTLL